MLLKIYLGISIFCFIAMILANSSTVHRAKVMYGNRLGKEKKDIAGLILTHIKMLIMSFIPLWNIVLLITMIFFGNKISKEADETVEKAMKEKEKKEKH